MLSKVPGGGQWPAPIDAAPINFGLNAVIWTQSLITIQVKTSCYTEASSAQV